VIHQRPNVKPSDDAGKDKAAYQNFLTLWRDAILSLQSSSLRKQSTQNYSSSCCNSALKFLSTPGLSGKTGKVASPESTSAVTASGVVPLSCSIENEEFS
jgi:hypothetical protein